MTNGAIHRAMHLLRCIRRLAILNQKRFLLWPKTVELSTAYRASRWRSPSLRPVALRRWTRPALGLLLPVGLAVVWELVVRSGLSNGRLVPPPSKIFATIVDLARTGEPRAPHRGDPDAGSRGLWLRRGRRHRARRGFRLLGPGTPAARPKRTGAACDPVDRLGPTVHPVARHLRDIEGGADRGRGCFFHGLSRRDGCDPVGRPQDRRSRPHFSPERSGDDPPYPGCPRCCRPMWSRCGSASGSAGCSWSRPNSWAPPKGWAIF